MDPYILMYKRRNDDMTPFKGHSMSIIKLSEWRAEWFNYGWLSLANLFPSYKTAFQAKWLIVNGIFTFN